MSMISTTSPPQTNLTRKPILEKSEKLKCGNIGTAKPQGFVKSSFTSRQSAFVISSKVATNPSISKKSSSHPNSQNIGLVKVGNFNDKNVVYNKSSATTSQNGQRSIQIAQVNPLLDGCETIVKLHGSHELCQTTLSGNTMTSAVSTVISPFNYTACTSSGLQIDRAVIAVDREDTDHGDKEESENSKSYSKKDKSVC